MDMTDVDPVRYTKQPVALFPLVTRFYKQARYPAKPGRQEQVFTASCSQNSSEIVAALRLLPGPEFQGQQWYCLRSLVTAPLWRQRGVAIGLLQAVFNPAFTASVYCFALEGTQSLYGRVGFVQVQESQTPEFIAQGYRRYRSQGRKICIMIRKVDEAVHV